MAGGHVDGVNMPTRAPEVSVIVPCYNAAETLPATLASIQAQTQRDWEALCVDDASSDGTPGLLAAAAAVDSRIRVVPVPHGGVAAARNAGVALTQAPYVLFLDADDVLRPTALATLLRAARRAGPRALAAGGYELLDQAGRTLNIYHFPTPGAFEFDALLRGNQLSPTTLVPRAVLGAAPFDAALPTCEDWNLWLRLAHEDVGCVTVPQVIYGFRLRHGSLTHAADRLYRAGRMVLDKWGPHARARNDLPGHYRRLGWTCGAMAAASGAPDAVLTYLRGLPPVAVTPEYEQEVAGAIHAAFQFVRGAQGQTWGAHRAEWLEEARAWLTGTPLAASADAIVERAPAFPLNAVGRYAAVNEFLDRYPRTQRLVVYGVGLNGLVLLEMLCSDGGGGRPRLSVADDFAALEVLAAFGLPTDDPRRWGHWPHGTRVVITPNDHAAMRTTLRLAGGQEGVDFLVLTREAGLLEHAAAEVTCR
jgi:hypothetical protein